MQKYAIARVTSGYISPSIRNAEMHGLTIRTGDTIGIVDKEIVVAEAERMDATFGLISYLLSLGDKFMLTIFVGADACEEETGKIEEYVTQKHSGVELYFIQGDQEVYPFIFVAE